MEGNVAERPVETMRFDFVARAPPAAMRRLVQLYEYMYGDVVTVNFLCFMVRRAVHEVMEETLGAGPRISEYEVMWPALLEMEGSDGEEQDDDAGQA